MKKISGIIVLAVLMATLFGCANEAPYFVVPPEWSTQNVDPTYWSKSGASGSDSAYRSFRVYAADPDGAHDIDLITVTDPNGNAWTLLNLDLKIELYNDAGGFWGGWFLFWPTLQYKVLLGEYTVLLKDRSGAEVTGILDFTLPGSTSGSGFLYSDEYVGSTVGGTEMLHRAIVTSSVKGGSDLTIEFQVDDTSVNNGQIWIYDNNEDLITESDYFESTINGGGGIFTDNSTNTLVLSPGDLDPGSYSWSDIVGFHVILVDGAQYTPGGTEWDHRSVSAYEVFP